MKVIKHTDCVYVAAENGKVIKYEGVKFRVAIVVNPAPIDRFIETRDDIPTEERMNNEADNL